ncbi:MAG: hypothetical protein GY705_11630 [Bacteroidetes bacterium]|nr:hypothetical protein [Bacteroidota bacterium]
MKYPVFQIIEVSTKNDTTILSGTLDRIKQGKENWIGDCFIGSLMKGKIIAFGRWFKKENDVWEFHFDKEEKGKLHLEANESIYAIDGYWGERAEITLDETIEWKKCLFFTEGNWDHEHCAICWSTISENENQEYFIGNNKHPICIECYRNHIQPRDISYITNV